MADDPVNDLLLKHEPFWGTTKVDNLKLIYEIGDEDRQRRVKKILALSGKKLFDENQLNNFVLLPPSPKEACYGDGEIFVGDVCYGRTTSGEDRIYCPLYLNLSDIQNHVIITGGSGTGKTTLAYNLVSELASKDQTILIIDWNRTWRGFLTLNEKEHSFAKSTRVFTIGRDIYPFKHNLFFSPPEGINPLNWIGVIAGKPLQKSLMSGLGVENLLLNECEQLLGAYKQGTLSLLPNIEDIKKRIENVFLKGRAGLWQQSAIRVLSELCRPQSKDVFSSRNPLDIGREILEHKGITILEMDLEFPYHLRILFQEMLLNYILLYYMKRGETDQLRLVLVMEEFQNMLPQSFHERQVGGETIKNLFRESRKLGIGTVSIAQEASELGNFVLANCKTQLHFTTVTKIDIDTVANGLFLKPPQIRYIDYFWRGKCLAKIKGRTTNMLIKTHPPPFTDKITDEQLTEISQKWQSQKSE